MLKGELGSFNWIDKIQYGIVGCSSDDLLIQLCVSLAKLTALFLKI